MSAVLEIQTCVSEIPDTPVTAARAALEAVRSELAQLDERIRGYEREREEIEAQRLEYNRSVIRAVSANQPIPKPPEVKQTNAEQALPILHNNRKKLLERVGECEGKVRSAKVDYVMEHKRKVLDRFAAWAVEGTELWAELIGTQGHVEAAGVTKHPLPPALYDDFSIPAVGTLRPLAENHWLFFLASHSIQQGAGRKAMWAARERIEGEIGKLPW